MTAFQSLIQELATLWRVPVQTSPEPCGWCKEPMRAPGANTYGTAAHGRVCRVECYDEANAYTARVRALRAFEGRA